jgi:hypothetical protein
LADQLQSPGRNFCGRLRELGIDHQNWAQVELLLAEIAECSRQVTGGIALAKTFRSQITEYRIVAGQVAVIDERERVADQHELRGAVQPGWGRLPTSIARR